MSLKHAKLCSVVDKEEKIVIKFLEKLGEEGLNLPSK